MNEFLPGAATFELMEILIHVWEIAGGFLPVKT